MGEELTERSETAEGGGGEKSVSPSDMKSSHSRFYDYVRLREITDCGLKQQIKNKKKEGHLCIIIIQRKKEEQHYKLA